MKRDGHIHTPYCPHGSKDTFEQYIEKAIALGYEEITFTEHAPLPEGFIDPTPDQDSGMELGHLEQYLYDLQKVKKIYENELVIKIGLEVDFIEGYENETAKFLNQYGPALDDAILSVHFLLHKGEYECIDFSHEVFSRMAARYGTVDHVHSHYYQTVLKSITSDLGKEKPERIGHITLARKFQKRYPWTLSHEEEIDAILRAINERGYELDYNGAGSVKPDCGEVYPPEDIAKKAQFLGIPLIYGSDAHQAKDLAQGHSQLIFL
ncbi:histidinol-phosphatase HisJ [Jeotgalibacillus soli]|uniref:Histidinol-phosphatase n=1 Tax=Jeotgalibacillus soli TaxID=889306 RepID=A0A0C2RQ26_9BACL|nr:histidinol-phosphatase HisJ [Jeotgalibacillus soli]KIL43864.1 histidinol-phosphatase [Jeotgalibacillus soli]